jgi:low affinity Fe/Cu permease
MTVTASSNSASASAPPGTPASPGVREWFRRFAAWTAVAMGSPWAFVAGVVVIIAWAVTGPLFQYSNTWQLVINTGTTIVTFLMVFLIQNSQNRDGKAIQLKLDELIRAVKGARNRLVELENCSDEELAELKAEFEKIRQRADGKKKKTTEKVIAGVEREEHKRMTTA